MSSNENSKIQQIKLNAHKHFYNKYSNSIKNYDQMRIHILVYSLKSHIFTIYKDYLLWDYTADFLKRFYKTKESLIKIPKIAIYYKSYCRFFCRPFLTNFKFSAELQNYSDNQAEAFYKQAYGSLKSSNNDNIKNKQIEIELIGEECKRILHEPRINDDLITIFNTSARKVIENNILTTIDFMTTQSENQDILSLPNNEDFFTIGGHNDFLIDLLSNFTNNKTKKNSHYAKIPGLQMLSKAINNKIPKKDNNTINTQKPEPHVTYDSPKLIEKQKVSRQHMKVFKSSYCNLYKQKLIPLDTKPNSNKKTINSNKTSTLQLLSPKHQINSKFTDFKKNKPQSNSKSKSKSKSKKNSLVGKPNVSEIQRPQHTSYSKTNQFKYSVDKKYAINKTTLKNTTIKKGKETITEEQIKIKALKNTKNTSQIFKKSLSPANNANPNLLVNYLQNCCNSRQTKSKCDNYLSVRNISIEQHVPLQHNTKSKNKTAHHQHNNSSSNTMVMNTAQNMKSNIGNKILDINSNTNKRFKHLLKKINFKPGEIHTNKRESKLSANTELNSLQPKIHTKCISYTATTSPSTKEMICRNKSHSNVFNEQIKDSHTAEADKLFHGIKMNLNSKRVVSDIINKKNNNKSIKPNDSSQTTSNTNQGHGSSKSPKQLENKKTNKNPDSNRNSGNNSKVIKSGKQSRRGSPGNLIKIFFNQRK